jgi:hypothetical protein
LDIFVVRAAIQALIAGNREWQLKYQELLDIQQLMSGVETEVPSMRFTKNVMEEIARHQIAPATNSYINKNIIRGIAACFLLPMAVAFVYALTQLKGPGNNTPSLVSYDHAIQNHLEKINWNRIFSNTYVNIFVMINLILGLMLLDLYLQRNRRRTSHPQA